MAPGLETLLKSLKGGVAAEQPASLFERARKKHQDDHDRLLRRPGGGENPYLIHQELGDIMTRTATVVRQNSQLAAAYEKVCELALRVERCSLSDTGQWTNQNVVFTKALRDMIPVALVILKGALQRDECRGAHYKPEFALPGVEAADPAQRRKLAEAWCDRFEESTARWLKSTIAVYSADGKPELSYEDVDTSLIPPRPRLYGLVGGDVIEQVWKERSMGRQRVAAPISVAEPTSTPAKMPA